MFTFAEIEILQNRLPDHRKEKNCKNNLLYITLQLRQGTVKKRLVINFKLRIPLGTFTYCPQVLVKVMNSQSLCLMLMIRNFY